MLLSGHRFILSYAHQKPTIMDVINELINTPRDCQIVSSRMVNAPLAFVYKAWTDPEYLSKWWGPAGFTNTFHEYDFRVGGKWKFTMHGPDNQGNFENESVFLQIESPDAIAFHHVSPPEFKIAATFESLSANETEITFRMVFDTPEQCEKIRSFAPEKNEENFDRLEEVLKNMA